MPISDVHGRDICFLFHCELLVSSVGLSRYTSHSLRRGGATALAEANVPLHDIKVIGDWKSLSVLLYLERSLESKIDCSLLEIFFFLLGVSYAPIKSH